jgi:zinc and cadmium transporter
MNLLGDAVHNFIDGMIIGASYLISMPVGIATTIAVALHEIPQEIGDFGVLIRGGFSRRKALMFNFLARLLPCWDW